MLLENTLILDCSLLMADSARLTFLFDALLMSISSFALSAVLFVFYAEFTLWFFVVKGLIKLSDASIVFMLSSLSFLRFLGSTIF